LNRPGTAAGNITCFYKTGNITCGGFNGNSLLCILRNDTMLIDMNAYTKDDMLYPETYTWDYREEMNTIEIDKRNGYEVLYYANYYVEKFYGFPLKGDLHKIEHMLRFRVPKKMVAISEITQYIYDNW
jgi:hypothetical protein